MISVFGSIRPIHMHDLFIIAKINTFKRPLEVEEEWSKKGLSNLIQDASLSLQVSLLKPR